MPSIPSGSTPAPPKTTSCGLRKGHKTRAGSPVAPRRLRSLSCPGGRRPEGLPNEQGSTEQSRQQGWRCSAQREVQRRRWVSNLLAAQEGSLARFVYVRAVGRFYRRRGPAPRASPLPDPLLPAQQGTGTHPSPPPSSRCTLPWLGGAGWSGRLLRKPL